MKIINRDFHDLSMQTSEDLQLGFGLFWFSDGVTSLTQRRLPRATASCDCVVEERGARGEGGAKPHHKSPYVVSWRPVGRGARGGWHVLHDPRWEREEQEAHPRRAREALGAQSTRWSSPCPGHAWRCGCNGQPDSAADRALAVVGAGCEIVAQQSVASEARRMAFEVPAANKNHILIKVTPIPVVKKGYSAALWWVPKGLLC